VFEVWEREQRLGGFFLRDFDVGIGDDLLDRRPTAS
jgi:hypothetical protein